MAVDNKLLFVYGSLLKGFHNHLLLDTPEVEYCGKFETTPSFTMVDLGAFPAVLDEGRDSIKGELYRVSEAVWERVEYLEGYPSFYDRTPVTTPLGEATMYVLNREQPGNNYGQTVVAGGDWRKHTERKDGDSYF